MAQGPKISNDPIEIMTNKYLVEEPFINKYWGPGIVALLGFSACCAANWQGKRPLLSGFQRHILFTVGGGFLGKFISDYRDGYFAERDAVIRHYIELHREDFPPLENKKIAEIFESWTPIR